MARNVLVTGAAGFIGSRLCSALVDRGDAVWGVGRNLEGPLPGVRCRRGDLADREFAVEVIAESRPDTIYHFAGVPSGVREREMVWPTLAGNLLTTVNVLLAAEEFACRRVVVAGSLEESAGNDPEPPTSPYAASKMAALTYSRMFSELYGTSVINLRIGMVYGPGQRDTSKLVPYVICSCLDGKRPALTNGRREVDWVYVDDVVGAAMHAGDLDGSSSHTVGIGTGIATSIRVVAETVAELCGGRVEPEFGARPDRPKDRRRVADPIPARDLLGWTAETSLREGLGRTVEWYRRVLKETLQAGATFNMTKLRDNVHDSVRDNE